jgi:hypothetical protein
MSPWARSRTAFTEPAKGVPRVMTRRVMSRWPSTSVKYRAMSPPMEWHTSDSWGLGRLGS